MPVKLLVYDMAGTKVQYVIAGTMGSCSRLELQANHSGYIIDALKGYRQ